MLRGARALMDSLLYLGAADDDDDDEQEEEEEEADEKKYPRSGAAGSSSVSTSDIDFAALQRAGYSTSTDLRETETYRLLGEEEDRKREEKKAAAEAAAEAEISRLKAAEEEKEMLLNQKKMDEKIGYKKRFDEKGENFRTKEKRKREIGQQSRCAAWAASNVESGFKPTSKVTFL